VIHPDETIGPINVDGGHGLRRGPDMSAMLEPVFGADGLRGVVQG
jgi:7-alpha-hydroxysteroid dehydrogenase